MNINSVYCIAEFTAKDGREQELYDKLNSLEAETHLENGCIMYSVMQQINNEYAKGTGHKIIMNEIWRDESSFNKHNNKDHILKFFNAECVDENGSCKDYNVRLFKKNIK